MSVHKPCLGRERAIEFNVTPMIDVVFLLIIFFLVSSHLARQQPPVDLSLPQAASGLADAQRRPPQATVNLLSDGRVLWGALPVEIDALAENLRRGDEGRDFQVRIRADRAATFAELEPVLAACADAGVSDVRFAVARELSESTP